LACREGTGMLLSRPCLTLRSLGVAPLRAAVKATLNEVPPIPRACRHTQPAVRSLAWLMRPFACRVACCRQPVVAPQQHSRRAQLVVHTHVQASSLYLRMPCDSTAELPSLRPTCAPGSNAVERRCAATSSNKSCAARRAPWQLSSMLCLTNSAPCWSAWRACTGNAVGRQRAVLLPDQPPALGAAVPRPRQAAVARGLVGRCALCIQRQPIPALFQVQTYHLLLGPQVFGLVKLLLCVASLAGLRYSPCK
jgi:hypothetical protein